MAAMKPRRPYLLRALYEWIVDSGCSPYLLVDAGTPGVHVPREFVSEGRIVLNVAPRAIRSLEMGEWMVSFECRFGGTPMQVELPMASLLAVYAQETGEGMVFEPEPGLESADAPAAEEEGRDGDGPDDGSGGGPRLRVVK